MINEDQVKELFVKAREFEKYFIDKGYTRDKKLLRYNDCVEIAIKTAKLSGLYKHDIAIESLKEIVEGCFKESLMYTSLGPKSYIQDWMTDESISSL